MGLLRTTCDQCGTDLWRWSSHRYRECKIIQDKQKAEEQDLIPLHSVPEDIDDYVYRSWLENHGYPVERLKHNHPPFHYYTSKEGRKALDNVEFINPRETRPATSFTVDERIDRGDTTYLKSNYGTEIIVEVYEDYPTEKLLDSDGWRGGELIVKTEEDPLETDKTTTYTQEFAKIGTAYIKENLLASEI